MKNAVIRAGQLGTAFLQFDYGGAKWGSHDPFCRLVSAARLPYPPGPVRLTPGRAFFSKKKMARHNELKCLIVGAPLRGNPMRLQRSATVHYTRDAIGGATPI